MHDPDLCRYRKQLVCAVQNVILKPNQPRLDDFASVQG